MSQADESLKNRYLQMSIEELIQFESSFAEHDFTPEAQKAIKDVLDKRRNEIESYRKQPAIDKTPIEKVSVDLPRGIAWKIYLALFVIFRVLMIFEKLDAISVFFGGIHLLLTSMVLYSWVWAKHIRWLSHIRWLVKLWSIQFFIAPIALIFHGLNCINADFQIVNNESLGWVISIIIQYPALFVVYRVAWKSRLLYKSS